MSHSKVWHRMPHPYEAYFAGVIYAYVCIYILGITQIVGYYLGPLA